MTTRAATLEIESGEVLRLRAEITDLQNRIVDLTQSTGSEISDLRLTVQELQRERDALLARSQGEPNPDILFPLDLPHEPLMCPEDIAFIGEHGLVRWRRHASPSALPIHTDGQYAQMVNDMAGTLTIELEQLLGAPIPKLKFKESCGRVICLALSRSRGDLPRYSLTRAMPAPLEIDVVHLMMTLERARTAALNSYYHMVAGFWRGNYGQFASDDTTLKQLCQIAATIAPYQLLPCEFTYLLDHFHAFATDLRAANGS